MARGVRWDVREARCVVKRALLLLFVALPLFAQFKNGSQTTLLNLPRTSPRSVLTQRIGLTDVTITYHRPQAKGRVVFGGLVPYDKVWRTGANDNTSIEFADPITIDGQALPAGRYGVHSIPGRDEWTVIFSKNSTSWGSFTYNEKEDALRVKIKPTEGPLRDELTFDFTDLQPDSATLKLEWDRVVVPLHLTVDTKAITEASLRNELRHLAGFHGEAFSMRRCTWSTTSMTTNRR